MDRTGESGAKAGHGRGPLQGIRILDFTWQATGPYATELLGFLGAQVIKVEARIRPDTIRQYAEMHAWPDFNTDVDAGHYFHDLNLNKLGLGLNLKGPHASDILEGLVASSDVVLDNMTPGVFTRLVGDFDYLRSIKPDVIFGELSARGSTQGSHPGYAGIFAATGGLANLTGYEDGPPSHMRLPVDLTCGTYFAVAILAALWQRQQTGEGQFIDLACQEVAACLIGDTVLEASLGWPEATRAGNRHGSWEPHDCYPCAGEDEWVSIAVRTEDEWLRFCDAINRPDLKEHPSLARAAGRRENRELIAEAISGWTADLTKHEAANRLQEHRVAAYPSMNFADLRQDEHLAARNYWQHVPHPLMGDVLCSSPPWQFKKHPFSNLSPSPLLGQHNEAILCGLLGFDEDYLQQAVEDGSIDPPTPRPKLEVESFVDWDDSSPFVGINDRQVAHDADGSGNGSLSDVAVLELGQLPSAAYCGRVLAQLGADVIKVETPQADRGRTDEEVAAFAYQNAGKRSVTMALDSNGGTDLLDRLADAVDLVIVACPDGRPPVDLRHLQAVAAGTSIVVISPFGQEGPNAKLSMAPLNTFHASGQGYLTPPTLDYLDRPPLKAARLAGDYAAGAGAAVACLGALFSKRLDGDGEYVDFSEQEFGINMDRMFGVRYEVQGVIENRRTQAHPWSGAYECRDGWVFFLCLEQHQWEGLAKAIGQDHLLDDERLSTPAGRKEHGAMLRKVISEWTATQSAADALAILGAAGVPIGPVRTPAEVLSEESMRDRQLFQPLHIGFGLSGESPTLPFQMTGNPTDRPLLLAGRGTDTDAVLDRLLGISSAELQQLRSDGVISDEPQKN